VQLVSQAKLESQGETGIVHATVQNPGKALALMVTLRLTNGKDGEDVTPVFWDDNYFSLLPGESRQITGRYDLPILAGKEVELEISGWNVVANTISSLPKL